MEKMSKIIKNIAVAAVLLVCAMFIVRCIMVSDRRAFSSPAPTEAFLAAYSDGESETLAVKTSDKLSADGYFSAYAMFYNTESGEVQLAVRWNRSVYTYTDMTPGYEFSFRLRNETTGAEYEGVTFDSDSAHLYQFRHVRFEGVEAGENDLLTAVMLLRDGFESTQVLKYAEQEFYEYKPGKNIFPEK